jgi:hypothetical protein
MWQAPAHWRRRRPRGRTLAVAMSQTPVGPRQQPLLQRCQAPASPATASRDCHQHPCSIPQQCLCKWVCAGAGMSPAPGLWMAQRDLLMAPPQPQLALVQRLALGGRQQQRRRPQRACPRHRFHQCRCPRRSRSAGHALCPACRLACCSSTPPQCERLAIEHEDHEPGGAAGSLRYVKRTWGTVAGAPLRFTPCDVDTTSLMVSCMRAKPERCSCSAEVPSD